MRRITLWLMSTIVAVVLLFSYRTSTMGVGGSAGTAAGAANPQGSNPQAEPSVGADGSKTYQGSTAQTRWGNVRVAITVAGGKITDVSVPVYPNGNGRDREINSYALPILQQETLAAQSAEIDTVSGATVTSGGYIQSLQAALDAAHL